MSYVILGSIINDPKINVRVSEQLNLERRGVDNEWLFAQVGLGRLTQQAYLELLMIKDVCENIYPGLWDIQVEQCEATVDVAYGASPYTVYFEHEDGDTSNYSNRNRDQDYIRIDEKIIILKFKIIIKFPEVEITNANDLSHTIRDIYFAFTYDYGILEDVTRRTPGVVPSRSLLRTLDCGVKYVIHPYKIRSTVYSCRETLTTQEFNTGYLHSHSRQRSLNGDKRFTKWNDCCLGSGEINQIFAMLDDFSPEVFTLLLFQLETYAKWESIDGGPYMHLTNLARGQVLADYYPLQNYSLEQYINALLNFYGNHSDTIPELTWQIVENRFVLVEDNKLKSFMSIHARTRDFSNLVGNYQTLIYYRNVQGEIFDVTRTTDVREYTQEALNEQYVVFQGEKRTLKIIQDSDIPMEEGFVFHPKAIQSIKSKLEGHANFKKTRDGIIKRISETGY